MRRYVYSAILCAALALVWSARADDSALLTPNQPMEVYVAPGRATTLLFRTSQKVAAISLASPIVTYRYDRALNQLEITPAVRSGGVETNLNLRIGPDVYVLLVKVVTDVRAQFVRTFDLANDTAADVNALRRQRGALVTVNDYLARRDAEWMSPIYNLLGLTVG